LEGANSAPPDAITGFKKEGKEKEGRENEIKERDIKIGWVSFGEK